jgi:CheY-like chemotaxis protein
LLLNYSKLAPTTKILIVEDNNIDARLTLQAIGEVADWPADIEVVDDGQKAIKFLNRQDGYASAARPDLLILDLNLPRCDGTEVLQHVRASKDLHNLLVFIFSSSPVDVAQERMHGAQVEADSYFEKPNAVSTYSSIAEEIRETYQRATAFRAGLLADSGSS